MTTGESNSNPVEVGGFCLDLRGPRLIALPIPNSNWGLITSIDFRLGIANNSSNALPLRIYQSVVPQLLTSDGQEIPRISVLEPELAPTPVNIPQQPNWVETFTRFFANLVNWLKFRNSAADYERILYLMSLEKYTSLTVTALLFWNHDRLQLKFIPFNNVSRFEALQAQQYRLRFIGINFNTNQPNFEVETTEIADSEQPASQFVNLRLVEPLVTNKNAVEVDGICFETVVGESIVQVSGTQPDSPIYMEFGMNITNNTLEPVRFNLFSSLVSQLIRSDGDLVQPALFYRMEIKLKESHFPLVMPGESISLLPFAAQLTWKKSNQLYLAIHAIDGGTWSFSNLNLGKYYIQFAYSNQNTEIEIYDEPDLQNLKFIPQLWTGLVFAPYVEFNLV
ncbi:MAG: hypothetical protein JGK24_32755 [Microcoleus sp. PH2017_29_MFU_D_A]|uniref:hypothetical protein n=1 Tax=unclassified Microcoleus TaxID=2642155 RepID=UPI001E1235FB|nr:MULTISPECIES: hypothetical protein [unclassified Microcoleus]MCC3513792.1 hypothetical protein [Microcoleus sp. PH2017_17_BER_D_A]TAG61031.1 MAG: hypothetical protein EAZ25_32320 [Oscillatoriales cyanobacterium]MCC3425159.1 hypothetical protein [Microcoleus sp. PH2017_01_SCD_O_A]MCC3607856.1 hypothetical protein [Microcoleus sp. PH2017_29_MFU_D_A]MCC3638995.1 hypothetical protein [Microcoleus sp. PH2017_37_MFU_D_B]